MVVLMVIHTQNKHVHIDGYFGVTYVGDIFCSFSTLTSQTVSIEFSIIRILRLPSFEFPEIIQSRQRYNKGLHYEEQNKKISQKLVSSGARIQDLRIYVNVLMTELSRHVLGSTSLN